MLAIMKEILLPYAVPVITFCIGLFFGLKKEINLQKREHLKKEIYEPLYDKLYYLKRSLYRYFISLEFSDYFDMFQEHGNINECNRFIRNKYISFYESFKYIRDNTNSFLISFRGVTEDQYKLYCKENKPAVFTNPLRVDWHEIINLDLKKLEGRPYVQLYVPIPKDGTGQYNFNLFKEWLSISMIEYFVKLKAELLENQVIGKYLDMLNNCEKHIDLLIEETKKRKIEPFTLWEYYIS